MADTLHIACHMAAHDKEQESIREEYFVRKQREEYIQDELLRRVKQFIHYDARQQVQTVFDTYVVILIKWTHTVVSAAALDRII